MNQRTSDATGILRWRANSIIVEQMSGGMIKFADFLFSIGGQNVGVTLASVTRRLLR